MRRALASALASSLSLALISSSVVVGVVATPSVARAADPQEQARKHYDDGIVQYNLTNYTGAIEQFKLAYELTRSPALLFNIAQAYRLAKDCAQALTFYRNYVREAPGAPNRADAEGLIKEVEACQAAAPAEPVVTPTPVPEPVAAISEPAPEPAIGAAPAVAPDAGSSGGGLRLAGWVTGGVGVATLGLGVVYGLKARGAQSDLEACTPTAPCTASKVSGLEDDGASWEKLGIGGMAVGAVLVGAGVTMVLMGSRGAASSESAVSAAPTQGGGAVFWQGRF